MAGLLHFSCNASVSREIHIFPVKKRWLEKKKAMAVEEKTIQERLSLLILLADSVRKSAEEAESSKSDCLEFAKQVGKLSHMLRSVVRLVAAQSSLYARPICRIAADVTKTLEKTLTLTRKCRKNGGGVLQVFSITGAADFRRVSSLLESSIWDMKWLLSIFGSEGINLSLPPIASNDPILAWVWSYIAAIQMGQVHDRVDAAVAVSFLASDNDRTKQIIVQEGGIGALLKLLKDAGSPDAQVAAANALFNIGSDSARVKLITHELGVPIIVKVICDSPVRVQIEVANLVARIAELDSIAQAELARENVTRPLVSLMSVDTIFDEPKLQIGKTSIHSLVQINREMVGKSWSHNNHRTNPDCKLRDNETPEMKMKLKISCARALWKLTKGNVLNSKKITETKGLICLAKIIEKESGELQYNCLMTVMEIAAVAEANVELRRSAFKSNSPAARAVLDQLVLIMQQEINPELQIPAIKAIGSLSRTFPAKEGRIIKPLVIQLGNNNIEIATEAAIALAKFVSPGNYNRVEYSKAIVELNGVPPLLRLFGKNERAQVHGLVLLCYLALYVGNCEALQQARALNALEGAARFVLAQYPDLRDLFTKAVHQLALYQSVVQLH